MKFHHFIGRRFPSCCPSLGRGLTAIAVLAAGTVLSVPEAQARYQAQFETDFDNRFFEFDPTTGFGATANRQVFFDPGTQGSTRLVPRQNFIQGLQNFPRFIEEQFTPNTPRPIILELEEGEEPPPGRIVMDGDTMILFPPTDPPRQTPPQRPVITPGTGPFNDAFSGFNTSLTSVQGRDGLEVRYDGKALVSDPILFNVAPQEVFTVAETRTDLVTDAQRYRYSARMRIDQLERTTNREIGGDPGFYMTFDLGNAGSGFFDLQFIKDQNNRNSIYLFNSNNNVTRRIGTFETGSEALRVVAEINATNSRLNLKIDGETVYRGAIALDNSQSYTPSVFHTLREKVATPSAANPPRGSAPFTGFSRVSLMNLNSYFNPEPGTVMVGIAGLSLLIKRRRQSA